MKTRFRKQLEEYHEQKRLARHYKMLFIQGCCLSLIMSTIVLIMKSDTLIALIRAVAKWFD